MPKKDFKVFGGHVILNGDPHRAIVAATSQRKAAIAIGVGVSTIRKYWSVTGNKVEVLIATRHPGIVFVCDREFSAPQKWQSIGRARESIVESQVIQVLEAPRYDGKNLIIDKEVHWLVGPGAGYVDVIRG